jgi:hypothetical protein
VTRTYFGCLALGLLACGGRGCGKTAALDLDAARSAAPAIAFDAGLDAAIANSDDDDEPPREAGTSCEPHVDVTWDEGLPDFHFAGFPCRSGSLLAYALSDEGRSESVAIIDMDKNTVSERAELIKREEVENAVENENGVGKAKIQARIEKANALLKGAWTYVHYSHGSDELESEVITISTFAFKVSADTLAITQGDKMLRSLPLTTWYGKHKTMLALSDIALVESWGFVAKSNADGAPEVLRIVPWKN